MDQQFALVTGASQGLGRAFATELAARGIHVLLTALPGEDLGSFSLQLNKRYGVITDFLECDLTRIEEIERLVAWVRSGYRVYILINNAGLGGSSEFEKTCAGLINKIILVNVRATAMITHQLLPLLTENKPSWILNVSSMASFSPIGYKTVYPASKVFILHFSRGLFEELRGTGVFVSVVHPGPMKTNRDTTLRIEKQGIFGKIGLLTPEYLARKSLTQLFKRDSLILIGWMNKVNWLLMKTIPIGIRLPLITKMIKREIQSKKQNLARHESIGYRSQQPAGRERNGRAARCRIYGQGLSEVHP